MPLFNSTKRPSLLSLAIWGPPQSGKTTMLAMMTSACESHGWTIVPYNKATTDYLERVTGDLFERGRPVAPTEVLSPTIHRFTLQRQEGRRFREFYLEMPDAAGEFYADPEHEVFNMINYLNGCEGIMWLLDPVALKKGEIYRRGDIERSYRQMITRSLSRIHQTKYMSSGRVSKYMAFVLTKMDHIEHVHGFNDPRNHALDLLGKEAQRVIENYCIAERVEFFATSSLGFKDKVSKESNFVEQGPDGPRLQNKVIEPIGVFDPLNWLLGNLT